MQKDIITDGAIEKRIFVVRGHRVILDRDLAAIYGVSTKRLNQQVQRNIDRFPQDFMFLLTEEEVISLRSHFATSSGRGGRRHLPHAFSEYGAIQAANVVRSKIAIQASIAVVRAFVRLRGLVSAHKELAAKLADLEARLSGHDKEIKSIVETIRRLTEGLSTPDENSGPKRRIGFNA